MNQICRAKKLIALLAEQGVEDFVLCAGARNASLVEVLSQARGINVLPFFDERSAAFFAIGRIQATQRPVAVITTSGTAAAELLPATIEAWYAGLPLVLVTADRPQSYRGSGAPQAIEQVGIFSHFVRQSWDLGDQEYWEGRIDLSQPSHINVCFEEPFLDAEVTEWHPSLARSVGTPAWHGEALKGRSKTDGSVLEVKGIDDFFEKASRPLVLVSRLSSLCRPMVECALKEWGWPIYAEATSGLRESSVLKDLRIESGEGIFESSRFLETFDGVIRIGGVPTTRLWRDLESKLSDWPVLNFSSGGHSGLSRVKNQAMPLDSVSLRRAPKSTECFRDFFIYDRQRGERLKNLLSLSLSSEPGIFSELSKMIPSSSLVFLGNSLPIREWDLTANFEYRGLEVLSNRGANGIDGLFSTFLGASKEGRENWAIVGDLSALYDLNAPWALSVSKGEIWRFIVINNFGGKIFHRMFGNPLFQNRHDLSFEGFAELWNIDYCRWHRVPEVLPELSSVSVIEIRPDQRATDCFWKDYLALKEVSVCF
ncbi:MAG: 2-succinyl-5-enolpyruvyl-6-hydroxy-3-cyclohexene-1-carboxylic-acid synthase [Bdellovibrionales bacterium]|nr:2-succinyl-5-enolpyruvyl-6-hydroxy-3-cyclohexene-1-carboxylic-acid synthase [Bdellovibrionales bacterium]